MAKYDSFIHSSLVNTFLLVRVIVDQVFISGWHDSPLQGNTNTHSDLETIYHHHSTYWHVWEVGGELETWRKLTQTWQKHAKCQTEGNARSGLKW